MNKIKLLLTILLFPFITISIGQTFEIYVSDAGNFNNPPWKILKFDENGENPITFIEDSIVWPQDIVFLEDQDLVLISSLKTDGYISKHDISTGEFVGYFAEGIAGPTRMKIGSDSLLYVLQWSNTSNKVLRYKLDGTFVDEFTSIGVTQSIGLDWDQSGNLYISSYGGKFVQKFDTAGNDMGRFINSDLMGPTNIYFEENGNLMVVDYNAGKVKRFGSDGVYIEDYITGLNNPEGIAFFPNGNMLIGNGGTSAVKLFDNDGSFIEDIIPSGSGGLKTPNAVVIRHITSVSILEDSLEEGFISPSVGKQFKIQSDPDLINTIEIYNSSGALVKRVDTRIMKEWVANDISKGVYIAIATTNEGRLISKKLMVY